MQQSKEVLDFLLSGLRAFLEARRDGKVDLGDLMLLVDPITKLMPAIDKISEARAELDAMTDEQRQEIVDMFAEGLDLTDDEKEAKAEAIFDFVMHGVALARDLDQFAPNHNSVA